MFGAALYIIGKIVMMFNLLGLACEILIFVGELVGAAGVLLLFTCSDVDGDEYIHPNQKVYLKTGIPRNGEVKLEVKMEVEIEVKMDAPILQPN